MDVDQQNTDEEHAEAPASSKKKGGKLRQDKAAKGHLAVDSTVVEGKRHRKSVDTFKPESFTKKADDSKPQEVRKSTCCVQNTDDSSACSVPFSRSILLEHRVLVRNSATYPMVSSCNFRCLMWIFLVVGCAAAIMTPLCVSTSALACNIVQFRCCHNKSHGEPWGAMGNRLQIL